jgi:hypothetical protein
LNRSEAAIELKRTRDGGQMEVQAIRMVEKRDMKADATTG